MTEESISNKLSELFDLFKSGALTKEEYESLKAKIINKEEVQPVIEKVQEPEPEPDQEVKKEIVIEQPKKLNNKDSESNQSIVEPVAKSNKKLGKKAIIAVVVCILIVVSIVLLVFKTNIFSGKSGLAGQKAQTVQDIDGNKYKTVTIGTQVWFAENLKTTKYNDGTTIPLNPDEKAWETLNTPAYCWYDNNETVNKNTCGALYNWYTVNTNKLCPTGWHVPTNEEWTTLITYLGGEDVAGGKIKETGTIHWKSPNTGATNETGFTALPSGYFHHLGTFKGIGSIDYWWSASEYDATHAWNSNVSYNHSKANRNNFMFQNGLSVRCLQNLSASKNNLPVNNTPIVENKTIVWDETAATKIIMDELRQHPWYKVDYIDTSKLIHRIVGFTKLSLKDKDVIVALTLSKNSDSERSGVPSLFEFNNSNGWKLVKNQIGIGEFTENVNLYKIATDKYCLLTSRIESGMGQSWEYKVLYVFIKGEFKKIFDTPNDLKFITKVDGYYDIEVTPKGGQPEIYKFNGNEYVQQ